TGTIYRARRPTGDRFAIRHDSLAAKGGGLPARSLYSEEKETVAQPISLRRHHMSPLRRTSRLLCIALTPFVLVASMLVGFSPLNIGASSHREAPLISSDPDADGTDFYMFVSPDRQDSVTFIANYIPFE